MDAARPSSRANRRGPALARLLIYLACSGTLHAAPLLLWPEGAPGEGAEPLPTRVQLLDPAEEEALESRPSPVRRPEGAAREEPATAATPAGSPRSAPPAAPATPSAAKPSGARRAPNPPSAMPRPAEKPEGAEKRVTTESAAIAERAEKADTTKEKPSPKRAEPVVAIDRTDVRQVKASTATPAERTAKALTDKARADASAPTTRPPDAETPRSRVEPPETTEAKPAVKATAPARSAPVPAAPAPKLVAPTLPVPPGEAAAPVPAAPRPPAPAAPPPSEAAPKPPPAPPDARASETTELRERAQDVRREAAAAPPQQANAGRGSGGGAAQEWLPFVRSEGAASGKANGDARYISDRDKSAPEDTRAKASVTRSNGDGTGDAEIAERTAPSTRPVVAVDRPEAAPATPPPSTRARSVATTTLSPEPTSSVALPYLAPSPAPASSASPGGMRLSAGEIPEIAEPLARGDEAAAAPPLRARVPKASRRPIRAPVVPASAEPPSAAPLVAAPPAPIRPALADDFWASTAPDTAPVGPVAAPSSETAIMTQNDMSAQGWSDLAILDERAALADTAAYGARAHPLGAWLTVVDDQIRQRWIYPPALRALGQQGTVVVRFYVARSGLVTQAQVRAGSGWPDLDLAALSAVPAHVSAMPPGNGSGVWLQWTFRYRADRP